MVINKKKIVALIVVIITIIGITILVNNKNKKEEKYENKIEQEKQTINIETEENVTEQEREEINEIKQNTGITGDTNLYEIQEDNDIKVPVIKASIKYKVAFAGMIKNSKPEINTVDEILKENHPEKAGIWVYEKHRNRVLKMVNNITNNEYQINESGYLEISYKNNSNEYDEKIEKMINGDKLCILNVSSMCYIVDDVTGDILDYNFENMDKYQTYEYFEDDNKMIVFMSENNEGQLDNSDIIKSVLELVTA